MTVAMVVSDVGGTNGRFAIAEYNGSGTLPQLSSVAVLQCNQFDTFADMLRTYLEGLDREIPKTARFAIAGEMEPRRGYLWHFNWDISAEQLEKQFNFENVTLLNDYEALIYAIPHLNTNDIKTISKVTTGLDGAPFGAFGVGSGLGAAIGVPYKNNVSAVPTEIGHISFGSRSKREYKLMRHYKKSITHISIETFLSGPGLTRIYDFLKDPDQPSRTAAEITTYAQSGKCETCINTLMMFTNMLARITGDIALAHGARGGIYIGGGIIPRIVDFIDMKRFMKHFHNKGPMRSYVEGIPVHIITTEMPSLLGAAIKL